MSAYGVPVPVGELRISPKPVLAVLATLATVISFTPGFLPLGKQVPFALLIFFLSASAWLLGNRLPGLARWLTVAILAGSLKMMDLWLLGPGATALVAMPVAVAAAMIGGSAATVVATAQTLLLLLLPAPEGTGMLANTLALAAIWGTLGVMLAVYHPLYQFVGWSWKHYESAQRQLEEARDRRVELKQSLEDLAAANLQLTRLNNLAQGLRQAAEEARRAKEQFVANVSHELRTPLNMIIGYSEMMVKAPAVYGAGLPRKLLADLNVISRNSRHLSSLIDDVLDLSQIEAGHMALQKERVALPEILEAATAAVRPLFDSKGLYLELEAPTALPLLLCDRARIRQVLLNLLSNAGRFTERGGVRVRAWQEKQDLVISVADTGPGIAAGDMNRIFQPFQQLDASLGRRYGGSGLGLSISKSFVAAHGGSIWVESKPGAGTTFFFRLPIDPPAPVDAGALRWLRPDWEYKQRTRRSRAPVPVVHPRFVVLERGDSLGRLIRRYVDRAEVAAASEWAEARQEMARMPIQALLINEASISQGLQMLASQASLPYGVPAIVCSLPDAHQAAALLGVTDYLVKPVSQERLLAALDRLPIQGRTILVVDDEPETQQLFQRMLAASGCGYQVLRAADGRQALSLLRERPVDAILLDLAMPEMDGFQFLEARSQNPKLRSIPVLVVSARDPAGQPVVSSTLAVTRSGGFSATQLLACVQALSQILSPEARPGGPTPPGTLPE